MCQGGIGPLPHPAQAKNQRVKFIWRERELREKEAVSQTIANTRLSIERSSKRTERFNVAIYAPLGDTHFIG
jgi:hypothetical protein